MANRLSLCLFILLLDLSALQAQSWRQRVPLRRQPFLFSRSPFFRQRRLPLPFRPATIWRPRIAQAPWQRGFRRPRLPRPFAQPQFNGRGVPFAPRGVRPNNFMFRQPINGQNRINPFVNPFNNRLNTFPNQVQRFPNGFNRGFNQQVPTNNERPAVVTGTLDPSRITGVSNRFGLPQGRELLWQMSSPPSDDTNEFSGPGGATPNALARNQNRFNRPFNFPSNANVPNGNNILGPNGFNRNSIVPQANPNVPNGFNGNPLIPQTNMIFPQGSQQPQTPNLNGQIQPIRPNNIAPVQPNLNGQNQLIRPNNVASVPQRPQMPLTQEPLSVINAPGLQQVQNINRNPLFRNQQLQNTNRVQLNQQTNTGSPGVTGTGSPGTSQDSQQFASLPALPAVPTLQADVPNIQSGANSASIANAAQTINAQREVRVPIMPGVPGLPNVPTDAIRSNGTFDYVEVITISDADGNVYYQGLNTTDADHRRIENILNEIQKNQTKEAHRLGRAGLATLPNSGSGTTSGASSRFGQSGDSNATMVDPQFGGFPDPTSQPSNITVMDEHNNILYQGPELAEAELQARIRSKLEKQEQQKLVKAEQNSQNSASTSSGSTKQDVPPSPGSTVSRDQNMFNQFEGSVGFNPIATRFNPGSFEPSRNIPSRFPENFNPERERFAQRQNNLENSVTRTNDLNGRRPGINRSNLNIDMSNTRDRSNRISPSRDNFRNNMNTRSDSRMNSENRQSSRRDSSRTNERPRIDGQGKLFVQGPQQRQTADSSRPVSTLSRTVWSI